MDNFKQFFSQEQLSPNEFYYNLIKNKLNFVKMKN